MIKSEHSLLNTLKRKAWQSNTELFLAFSTVLFYFCFQMFFMYSAIVNGGNNCLSTIWLNETFIQTPFAIIVETVVLFLLYGLYQASIRLKNKVYNKNILAFYGCFILVVCYWLYGLYGMWRTFEFEKGNLSVDEYLLDEFKPYYEYSDPDYQCSLQRTDQVKQDSTDV